MSVSDMSGSYPMKYYNTQADGSDDDELPFDVEQQSLSTPIQMIPESRVDSMGLPVPPPPPPPITTLETTQSVSTQEVKQQTSEAKNMDRTPPRNKLFFTSKPSTPRTPDTVLSFMQEGEEEIVFSGPDDTKEEKYDDANDLSDDDCDTVVFENDNDNSKWNLATKSALGSMLLVILLAIFLLIAFYVSMKGSDENAGSADAITDFPGWRTARPSISPTQAPSEIFLTLTPTKAPTKGPTPFLFYTTAPTKTPSPSSLFVWTNRPTQTPTLGTPAPTFRPTAATPRPTPQPTVVGATPPPTNSFNGRITDFLFDDSSNSGNVDRTNPAVQKAVQWLVDEATAAQSIMFPLNSKYRQRFGILVLYYSVGPNHEQAGIPNLEMRNRDECTWIGMRCDENGMVTKIKMPNLQLDGRLPAEWDSFFPNLKSIDMSKNKLQGSIPEDLYDVLGLEEIYLYKNQLTGSISSKIGNLWSLQNFHVSQNRLAGSIPPELGSTSSKIRQVRYFNIHRNQLTGTIPANMRLRQLYYLDLGRNKFEGNLPPSLGTESVRLRHLHLDHNRFSSTFPSQVLNAGGGRLRSLTINDNQFTGTFPGNHQYNDTIVEMEIQNNNFVAMERSTCNLDVWSGGELVEFKSDCLVCRCGFGLMCQHCEL